MDKKIGLKDAVALGIGGMVGGGIFSILGISVVHIGNTTFIAYLVGGLLAYFATYYCVN